MSADAGGFGTPDCRGYAEQCEVSHVRRMGGDAERFLGFRLAFPPGWREASPRKNLVSVSGS